MSSPALEQEQSSSTPFGLLVPERMGKAVLGIAEQAFVGQLHHRLMSWRAVFGAGGDVWVRGRDAAQTRPNGFPYIDKD